MWDFCGVLRILSFTMFHKALRPYGFCFGKQRAEPEVLGIKVL